MMFMSSPREMLEVMDLSSVSTSSNFTIGEFGLETSFSVLCTLPLLLLVLMVVELEALGLSLEVAFLLCQLSRQSFHLCAPLCFRHGAESCRSLSSDES